jgi:hypothetical protein
MLRRRAYGFLEYVGHLRIQVPQKATRKGHTVKGITTVLAAIFKKVSQILTPTHHVHCTTSPASSEGGSWRTPLVKIWNLCMFGPTRVYLRHIQ